MTFQILSLSGGGYRGVFTAAILERIEARTKDSIASHFDLLAGTSIGGIIALALAAGVPATTVRNVFSDSGPRIFGMAAKSNGPLNTLLDLSKRMLRPKYRADALRATIEDIVGKDLRVGDLKRAVIIPAVNLSANRPRVFKTPHHPTFQEDRNLKLVEVALATSAAPTFFPIATIGGTQFADGGLFANSPDLLAVHEATQFLGANESDARILSVGTSTVSGAMPHVSNPDFGILRWFSNNRLLDTTIASQQSVVHWMMTHRFSDRYLRIDAELSSEQSSVVGLDVASPDARNTLLGVAENAYRSVSASPQLNIMLAHSAPASVMHT